MLMHLHILSVLIWLPIVAAVFVLAFSDDKRADWARFIALATVMVSLALCALLYTQFDLTTPKMQFEQIVPWIPQFGINYALGVDGISLPLVILSTLTTLVVVLAAWKSIQNRVAQYYAAFLFAQGMMVGVFSALDAMLFYVFWEALLIPVFLAIGIWGSSNRVYASIKFFLYTFAGSVLMLVALLYLQQKTGSFSIQSFYTVKLSMTEQIWIFAGLFFAFAVKVPMFPVHTWLPDAHTEAPAGGSVILAAIMLKMGIYGLLRFNLPIVPDASQYLASLMIALSIVAIVYIALVALVQKDMKRLIAYSSIAHMGFCTLGVFMVYKIVANTGQMQVASMAIEGALFQMVSHAFSTGALFLGVGVLYDRMHTRLIGDFGGVTNKMPVFASLFMLFAMANAGLPGTSGFVGEFYILLAAFSANIWIALAAATTLIFAAAYTLWMYKRVFFGEALSSGVKTLKDVSGTETLVLGLLAGIVIFLGVYPQILFRVLHSTVDHLLVLSTTSRLI